MAVPEMVAPGVLRLDVLRLENAITATLLENDDGWTLVDTGTEGGPGRIREALTTLGSEPEDPKRTLITHQHDDHGPILRENLRDRLREVVARCRY